MKDVRSIIVRKIGLPIGTFSLVTQAGKEMHDMHAVSDYDLELGAFYPVDSTVLSNMFVL